MKKRALFLLTTILYSLSCSVHQKPISADKQQSNTQIMFTSSRDKNFDVYIMNDDSTNVKNLTNNAATDYGQAWSPDGKYILFYSDRTGNEDIWRINNDGSNPINLTNAASSERNASYSPDGKTIVFTSDRDNKTLDLYLMNTDGSNVRRLTHNKLYCESPIWTKDGKQLLFTLEVKKEATDKVFNGELFIIDADGNNQKRLTHKAGFDSGAALSPNGKRIAFHGKSESGNTDIFTINIDGTDLINLTNDKLEDYSPSWSLDGNWLAFTSGSSANYDIWKMNTHTKEKIRLTSEAKRDETPYYKPTKR